MAGERSNSGSRRLGWTQLRPSVVVPIGVIVAVAIVCVVVAALGSAQRADDVALANERQLFARALTSQGERVLRDISSVAASEAAYRRIRLAFDPDWVQLSVGLRLQSFFEHDFVFVTDPSNHLLFASLGRRSVDPNWFNSVQGELQPVIDVMRGVSDSRGAIIIDGSGAAKHRAARLQSFLGRPAIVGALGGGKRSDHHAHDGNRNDHSDRHHDARTQLAPAQSAGAAVRTLSCQVRRPQGFFGAREVPWERFISLARTVEAPPATAARGVSFRWR